MLYYPAVVREHRDHGLVGWPLAKWGLCQFLWVHRCREGWASLGNGESIWQILNWVIWNGIVLIPTLVINTFYIYFGLCLYQRDIMIISDVLPVMVDDALVTSHPIIVNVSTPAQITSVFDSISYSKVILNCASFHLTSWDEIKCNEIKWVFKFIPNMFL